MFERVVMAVDFGGSSLEAASWVTRHLRPAEVILTHVVRPIVPPVYIRGALVDPEAELEDAVADASERLHGLRDRLAVDAVIDVRSGDPATELENAVREHDAGVVVVGERGVRRSAWGMRGRTTFALMARAGVPVWFAKPGADAAPRSVLAAIGAVPDGAQIISATRAAQQAWGARAELLHVVDRMFVPRPVTEEVAQHDLDTEVHREAEAWLGEQRRKARVRGTDVPLQVVIGDPASEILAAVYRGEHDLVIMRGPGPSTGLMPDRVARALMHSSPASLLRLPAPETPAAAA